MWQRYIAAKENKINQYRNRNVPVFFLCADPCSGIMPLARRTGRAASREEKPSLLDCIDPCRERGKVYGFGGTKVARRAGKKNLPYSIVQTRAGKEGKYTALAARRSRGEQGKISIADAERKLHTGIQKEKTPSAGGKLSLLILIFMERKKLFMFKVLST